MGQTGHSALLRRFWLFTCGYHCMNRSRDPIGQKPPLVLFLKLLAEADVSDEGNESQLM